MKELDQSQKELLHALLYEKISALRNKRIEMHIAHKSTIAIDILIKNYEDIKIVL